MPKKIFFKDKNTKGRDIKIKEDKIRNNEISTSPDIFLKKLKKYSVKNLTHVTNDTGETRHYTPAAQE